MRVRYPCLVVLTLAVLSLGSVAHAAPLGLFTTYPDINAAGLTISVGPGLLTATNPGPSTFLYSPEGVSAFYVTSASYNLSATLSGTGELTGGSLSIVGKIDSGQPDNPSFSIPLSTLLAGDLVAFGFTDPPGMSPLFEFGVHVTSSASGLGYNDLAGVIMQGFGFPDEWSIPTGTTFVGGGYSDNFAGIPEPTTLLLLAGGLGVFVGAKYRRRG